MDRATYVAANVSAEKSNGKFLDRCGFVGVVESTWSQQLTCSTCILNLLLGLHNVVV